MVAVKEGLALKVEGLPKAQAVVNGGNRIEGYPGGTAASRFWSCRSVYRRQNVCFAKVILWILTSCTYWWENR